MGIASAAGLLWLGCSATGDIEPAGTGGSSGTGAAGGTGAGPASTTGGAAASSTGGAAPTGGVGAQPSGGVGAQATGGAGAQPSGGVGAQPGGGSAGSPCPGGFTLCGSACVELTSDAQNCGSCGVVCMSPQVCSSGQCTTACAPNETLCGSSCVDVQTHPEHCGGCDRPCPEGQTCSAGSCVCSGGLATCGGVCVDTQTDPANCGACGQACGEGQICSSGRCECASGYDDCGGVCVDTQDSDANCGACGQACGAGLFCNVGECQSQDCPAGQKACDGVCTDVMGDAANCGDCGDICLHECCSGACVHTSSDPNNCGDCGRECRYPGVCEGYSCTCPPGSAYCDGDCADVQSDPHHCGGCDNDCGNDIACDWGACVCPDGLAFCDGGCRSMDECIVSEFGDGTGTAGTVWTGGEICPGNEIFTSKATWYEPGNSLPHCSFPPADFPQYVAALNEEDYAESATCGACARVHHPSSGKTLDVLIVDECPYAGNAQWCYPGSHHMDLSRDSFEFFADSGVGVLDVEWQYVDCQVTGNIEYAFKDGTTSYWTAIIFRNYPLPLVSVEYANASGIWHELTRVDYNYWLDMQGFGTGPYTIRVTDSAGSMLEDTIPHITEEVQTVQFHELSVQLPGCAAE